MNNLNSIMLEGNLVRYPELRFTPRGTAVCRFVIASNRYFKMHEEYQKEVSFFDVTVWAKLAETCGEYLKKGRGVRIIGRLKQDRWNGRNGKGRSKVVLITDATAASYSPPSRYSVGDLEVEADADGALRLAGTPYLTGSTLTMDRAIGNCAASAGIALASTIKMATVNPARLFEGISGKLEKGQRADLVLFTAKRKKITIEQVYLAGFEEELCVAGGEAEKDLEVLRCQKQGGD